MIKHLKSYIKYSTLSEKYNDAKAAYLNYLNYYNLDDNLTHYKTNYLFITDNRNYFIERLDYSWFVDATTTDNGDDKKSFIISNIIYSVSFESFHDIKKVLEALNNLSDFKLKLLAFKEPKKGYSSKSLMKKLKIS